MNSQTDIEPTPEQIGVCACLTREEEGQPQERHEAHWLQAEKQLKLDCARRGRSVATPGACGTSRANGSRAASDQAPQQLQTPGGRGRMTARREVEIRVRLPKTTGGPSEVLALLADHQLATLTRSCCADHEGLLLLLITSQTEEVQQVLEAAGYAVTRIPSCSSGRRSTGPAWPPACLRSWVSREWTFAIRICPPSHLTGVS